MQAFLIGILNIIALVIFTLICGVIVHLVALLKFLLPVSTIRVQLDKILYATPFLWNRANVSFFSWTTGMTIEVRGELNLQRDESYLVLPNHQSWTDIFILHGVFDPKISALRFFMKRSLIYIPIVGSACFLMGYPFMKRHTQAQIAKNPRLRFEDLATTKKFCERYRHHPVSVISFLEGTRYRPEKAKAQASPYQHLLKPKAGGVAFILGAMEGVLHQILDVTIAYEGKHYNFWDYVSGKLKRVIVEVKAHAIPPEIVGDYLQDERFRQNFQAWLNQLWHEKDARLQALLKELGSV